MKKIEILHILIRVSTQVQEEGTSLKTQRDLGIEMAKKLGMNYKVHDEGGTSSSKDTLENRPVLLNLLKMMDKGEVKHVYVWNTDRLSRNQITWYTIRQKMIKNGVVLYTNNGIHNAQDFMENMILGILSEVAQYDNKVRSERSRLGKVEKVKLNYWRGGDTPFGYGLAWDGKGNKLVENKAESKWIKYIFKEYAKGTPLKKVKDVLEEHQVQTRRGHNQWSMGSLQAIIRNETYIGIDTFIDKKSKETITNSIPQLVSEKLWQDVQGRRKVQLLRKGQINRTKKFYLLRDLMYCSCGTPIGGRIKEGKGISHYYCPLSERKFSNPSLEEKTCSMKRCLNIPDTDNLIWQKTIEIFGNSSLIIGRMKKENLTSSSQSQTQREKIVAEKTDKISKLQKIKSDLEHALTKIEKKSILEEEFSKIYKTIRSEMKSQLLQTSIELDQIKSSISETLNLELWESWIKNFSNELKKKRNISASKKRDILKGVIDTIVVDYDSAEKLHILNLTYKLPVYFRDADEGRGATRVSELDSIKSTKTPSQLNGLGLQVSNQNGTVGGYSTVTDFAKFLG